MDNRQYRQIVDDYADMVYRIALNQTRRVPDAEDVVQAVFLKLYEKPPAWLCDKAERDSGRAMAAEAERGAACDERLRAGQLPERHGVAEVAAGDHNDVRERKDLVERSEEHTSELQSLV